LGPTLAAVVAHRVATGNYRAFHLYTTWPRTVGTVAIGVALTLLAYVVLPAVTTADPRKPHGSVLTSVDVYNDSTLLGPLRGSILLALLWAATPGAGSQRHRGSTS
jgi:hypothetical protein